MDEKPILGLHIGGLGFLSESNKENYQKKILDIKAGNYYIEDRMIFNVDKNYIFDDKKVLKIVSAGISRNVTFYSN